MTDDSSDYDDDLDDYGDDLDVEDDGDLTPLASAAAAIHEVYIALVDAGFEEWEGLRIVSHIISDQVPTE